MQFLQTKIINIVFKHLYLLHSTLIILCSLYCRFWKWSTCCYCSPEHSHMLPRNLPVQRSIPQKMSDVTSDMRWGSGPGRQYMLTLPPLPLSSVSLPSYSSRNEFLKTNFLFLPGARERSATCPMRQLANSLKSCGFQIGDGCGVQTAFLAWPEVTVPLGRLPLLPPISPHVRFTMPGRKSWWRAGEDRRTRMLSRANIGGDWWWQWQPPLWNSTFHSHVEGKRPDVGSCVWPVLSALP